MILGVDINSLVHSSVECFEAVVPSKAANRTLSVASLFSGIGGFEAGLQKSGHKTLVMCELDADARAVLSERFAGIPIEHDIRLLESLPVECDVLTAGFPCQNLSQAGELGGIFGPESGLVWEVMRLLRGRPTPWVILENVPFMLSLDRGNAIRSLVTVLEELGYKWAYRVVDSRAFGTPQRRRRVFIVASLREDPRNVLLADDVAPLPPAEQSDKVAYGFYWTEGNTGLGLIVDAIPPLKPGSSLGIPAAPAVLLPNGNVVVPTIDDAERLQGFPVGWTAPAAVKGGSRGGRWRLVGNSVNMKLSTWLGRRLANPKIYHNKGDRLLLVEEKWPNAAYNIGEGRVVACVGEYPAAYACKPIGEFLSTDAKLLSSRATKGIVERLKSSRLKYPAKFLENLEQHLQRSIKAATSKGSRMSPISSPLDTLQPKSRSALMARVRQKNTKPELALRRLIWGMGYRYRLNDTRLPGSPDIVLPRYRKAVFVHGCFWHSHPKCKKATVPKTRRDFWVAKLAANVERDQRKEDALRGRGWDVLVVWECELREPDKVAARISNFMPKSSNTKQSEQP